MSKRLLNKRFFLTSVAASAAGILLSRLVIKPLMHMWGDPPWLRNAVLVASLGLVVGIFALALFLRLTASRNNGTKS